jgi:hypothetical protein
VSPSRRENASPVVCCYTKIYSLTWQHDTNGMLSCQNRMLCQSMAEPLREQIPNFQQVIFSLKLASILLYLIAA